MLIYTKSWINIRENRDNMYTTKIINTHMKITIHAPPVY